MHGEQEARATEKRSDNPSKYPWQDMDENSYVFRCSDPEELLSADTEDIVCGIYLSELYENHFGVQKSPLVLRELMVDWENGERHKNIPRIIVENDGCYVE